MQHVNKQQRQHLYCKSKRGDNLDNVRGGSKSRSVIMAWFAAVVKL